MQQPFTGLMGILRTIVLCCAMTKQSAEPKSKPASFMHPQATLKFVKYRLLFKIVTLKVLEIFSLSNKFSVKLVAKDLTLPQTLRNTTS